MTILQYISTHRYRMVSTACRLGVPNPEDIVQLVSEKMYNHYQDEKLDLDAWDNICYRCIYNENVNRLRSGKVKKWIAHEEILDYNEPSDDENFVSRVTSKDAVSQIKDLVMSRKRGAAIWEWLNGGTLKDVCETYEIAYSTFQSALKDVRAIVKERYEPT